MKNFEEILKKGQEKDASDIHITTGEKIFFRRAGKLQRDEESEVISPELLKEWIEKILDKNEKEKYYKEKELDKAFQNQWGRYRINFYWEMGNSAVSIRVLNKEIKKLSSEEYPEIIKKLLKCENGLILVTGATGSGKSTTLAAMIDELNTTRELSIVTIEDPVEYIFENKKSLIRQREIGKDTLSYAAALKGVLRQDPDVIMAGELRDIESIEAALTAAETGHLILSTLHTNGAAETINRIVDVFPAEKQEQIRTQLSMVLRGVISQQLVKNKIGGRTAAFEILVVNTAAASHIASGRVNQLGTVIESGKKAGMVSMKSYIEELIKKGII